MPTPKPPAKSKTPAPRRKSSAFRLSAETLAMIDAIADSLSAAPEMTVTKTAVIEMAVREMAERRLKGKKGAR